MVLEQDFDSVSWKIREEVFMNGPSKICGIQPSKIKRCIPQNLLVLFLNLRLMHE